jgi:hypothetical protein
MHACSAINARYCSSAVAPAIALLIFDVDVYNLLAGTSSVLAVSLLRPLLAAEGMDQQQRRALVGKLLGTHAHELTSVTQQLLAGYDAEAGRRCGLEVSNCSLCCSSRIRELHPSC